MLRFLKKVLDIGEKLQLVLGVICISLIVISVTAGIISRYVFNNPFSWTEELASLMFISLSFFGASVATARKKHIAVDFLTQKFSVRTTKNLYIVFNILIIMFLTVVFIGAVTLQKETSSLKSVILDIPKNIFYLPVAISTLYMWLFFTVDTVDAVVDHNRSKEDFVQSKGGVTS